MHNKGSKRNGILPMTVLRIFKKTCHFSFFFTHSHKKGSHFCFFCNLKVFATHLLTLWTSLRNNPNLMSFLIETTLFSRLPCLLNLHYRQHTYPQAVRRSLNKKTELNKVKLSRVVWRQLWNFIEFWVKFNRLHIWMNIIIDFFISCKIVPSC